VLRIALRATALRAALGPGDHYGPWGQEERAGTGLPPALRAARKPGGGWPQQQAERQDTAELAFDNRNKQKITNLGRCQGSSEADPSRIK